MKFLFHFLFFLVLISCSSQEKKSTLSDSVTKNSAPPVLAVTSTHSTMDSVNSSKHLTVLSRPKIVSSQLSEMSCVALIEKATDENFALKGLASLRAKKKCKEFSFDIKKLSDLEKKIFAEQIQDFEPITAITPNALSIAELKKIIKTSNLSSEKVKFFRQLRIKEKNAGLRNDFLKTTADLYNWTRSEVKKDAATDKDRMHYYEAAVLFAKTFWTENKLTRAEDVLSDALRILKGTNSVAEIYYLNGRMAEEKQDTEKAVQMYDLSLEDINTYKPKILSFTPERLLWLKAWMLYKDKKWAESEAAFLKLSQTTNEISEKSKALFFRSRALVELNHKEEAKIILEKIIQDDFFSYYGLVSYNELDRKLPALSKIQFNRTTTFDLNLTFLNSTEKSIFTQLITYGEFDIVEKAIVLLGRTPENQFNLGLYLAEKADRHLPLFSAFGKLDNKGRTEAILTYGHLLYPQPYAEQVKSMSEKTSLPASLIYSIMKQESAFNEKTRSHADAFGLMQMIPRLAKHLSKKFNIPYENPEDLYNPYINIQLGSYELMEQVKKQNGQLTYVAAAYNAGAGALSSWLKTRYRPDVVEFIEEIPYEETRTYVKLIARNMLFYDRLSKRDDEHSFPVGFLAPNDSKKDISAMKAMN